MNGSQSQGERNACSFRTTLLTLRPAKVAVSPALPFDKTKTNVCPKNRQFTNLENNERLEK